MLNLSRLMFIAILDLADFYFLAQHSNAKDASILNCQSPFGSERAEEYIGKNVTEYH